MNSPEESPSTTDSPSSPSVFEVGDKVLIAEKHPDWDSVDHTVGNTAIVTEVDECGGTVTLDDGLFHPISSLRHADYKPGAGDVVEFEKGGKRREGVVFAHSYYGGRLGVTYDETWEYLDKVTDVSKIGFCDKAPKSPYLPSDARKVLKAYFSEQSEPKSTKDDDWKED